MKVAIVGASGMLGVKLGRRLAFDGSLAGETISSLRLLDIVAPTAPGAPFAVETGAIDLTEDNATDDVLADRPNVIFHLAAVVSGQAEADFDLGYAVNFDGTRALLDAIRALHDSEGYTPRLVFASSLAVFGQPLPTTIPDTHHLTPLTSYGTQKAMCELLIADHTRRGHVEGVSIRLPTIVVRPGAPNAAASGFFSGILREPLAGERAALPVPDDTCHWFASPRAAIGFLLHAATLPMDEIGPHASLSVPGLSATVGEAIEALERHAGPDAAALIDREPDETVAKIVAGWPQGFEAKRAAALGFEAEASFDEILRVYVEDELG